MRALEREVGLKEVEKEKEKLYISFMFGDSHVPRVSQEIKRKKFVAN